MQNKNPTVILKEKKVKRILPAVIRRVILDSLIKSSPTPKEKKELIDFFVTLQKYF